jgi:beta-glucosidase
VATSAHQVEGGTTANTWSAWELTTRPDGGPAIAGNQRCGRAADHWERFETDLGLMRWLGVDTYRFSVEWSRVEPLPGHIDEAAIERYRTWCTTLLDAGIAPMVTLHHFTEPLWTSERGGFAHASTVEAWLRFVRLCAHRLGDLVLDWVTVNEPVAYMAQGWIRGEWPPGRRDPALAAEVLENLLIAHARAYHAIHDGDRAERRHRVGLAHNIMPMRSRRPLDPWNRVVAGMVDATYNRAVPEALRTGVLRLRLPGVRFTSRHPVLRGTQDFFGLNHYHRALVATRASATRPIDLLPTPGEPNDLGWSMEPSSLGDVLRWTRRYALPVVVTEHGTVDGDTPDVRRRRYLGASLVEMAAAARDGVDVRGYLHWSLLDNFEWTSGYGACCGLFRVDRSDLHRTPTTSAAFYRDVIAVQRGREDRLARHLTDGA